MGEDTDAVVPSLEGRVHREREGDWRMDGWGTGGREEKVGMLILINVFLLIELRLKASS